MANNVPIHVATEGLVSFSPLTIATDGYIGLPDVLFLTLEWPSHISPVANVWRLLDLSGMTRNVRESQGLVRSGYVWLNDVRVAGTKDLTPVGDRVRLEIRWPNGVVKARDIFIVSKSGHADRARSNSPTVLHRRG